MQIEIFLYLSLFQVIKSARVMKKAVAHLIPFMEEEREAHFATFRETMFGVVRNSWLGRSGS